MRSAPDTILKDSLMVVLEWHWLETPTATESGEIGRKGEVGAGVYRPVCGSVMHSHSAQGDWG